KLLPVGGTPNNSPASVPVTSPRTMTRSPARRISLMSNFMSGTDVAKPPTTLIEVSRPQHSPGRYPELRDATAVHSQRPANARGERPALTSARCSGLLSLHACHLGESRLIYM